MADSLIQKPPRPKNKFWIKTTEEYYEQIRNECEDLVSYNVKVTTIDKISKNLDVAKDSGIDQISAKFLKEGAPVIVTYLANITNLFLKLDTCFLKCKIPKIRPLLKKGITTLLYENPANQTYKYIVLS